jgi:hypothetical protein
VNVKAKGEEDTSVHVAQKKLLELRLATSIKNSVVCHSVRRTGKEKKNRTRKENEPGRLGRSLNLKRANERGIGIVKVNTACK